MEILSDSTTFSNPTTAEVVSKNAPTLYQQAIAYHGMGWCVIPIKPGTKKAAVTWKKHQTARPSEVQVFEWFGTGDTSMAVVLGEVSGGLVCRDFDAVGSYDAWAGIHPDIAQQLPTARTGRPGGHGRHVYFRADLEQVQHASASNGLVVKYPDGELRGGSCYCVLPPSVHESGSAYQWLIEPTKSIPFIGDIQEAGFAQAHVLNTKSETETPEVNRENIRKLKKTEVMCIGICVSVVSVHQDSSTGVVWTEDLQSAVLESLPKKPGTRNDNVFELARALRGLPAYADATVKELKPIVRRWHELALPVIGTKPFEETFVDFVRRWPKVKWAKGTGPMRDVFERAKKAATPQVALEYEQEKVRLLVAMCRELQLAAGDGPFFLACRTAGEFLDVSHVTAWKWLLLLKADDVIQETEKGSQAKKRASRFRYLPPL